MTDGATPTGSKDWRQSKGPATKPTKYNEHMSSRRPQDAASRDPNHRPCRVAPLEAFSDELAPDGLAEWVQPHHTRTTGRESSTTRIVLLSNCAGYKDPPTADELYDAMRRTTPTKRDLEVMRAWVVEATEREWFLAWTEQAYTWRMLARAVALTGWPQWGRIRRLNTFAKNMSVVPRDSLPVQ